MLNRFWQCSRHAQRKQADVLVGMMFTPFGDG
jgi:hypothetical protein